MNGLLISPHMLVLKQKPRIGNGFLRQRPAYQYRHRKIAIGGDDSASCVLYISVNEAEWWLENAVGNGVQFYADDPTYPIFDGFINRVTYSIGSAVFTQSVDDMFNRTTVDSYSKAAGAIATTTAIDVTASQNIYMIKHGQLAGEVDYGGTSKNALRSLIASRYAYPQVSFSPGGGTVELKIEVLGWYHVWEWQMYESTNTSAIDADAAILRITVNTSAEYPTNAQYIYATGAGGAGNTWAAQIIANPAFTISREATNGCTYWDRISEIATAGDTSSHWVVGITRQSAIQPTRYVYYRAAKPAVKYVQRVTNEPGILRDIYARRVNPWWVEPDNSIQATDVLFGWAQTAYDLRATYIEAVTYDADVQTITYEGGDNITPIGVFGVNNRFKFRGRRVKNRSPRETL